MPLSLGTDKSEPTRWCFMKILTIMVMFCLALPLQAKSTLVIQNWTNSKFNCQVTIQTKKLIRGTYGQKLRSETSTDVINVRIGRTVENWNIDKRPAWKKVYGQSGKKIIALQCRRIEGNDKYYTRTISKDNKHWEINS